MIKVVAFPHQRIYQGQIKITITTNSINNINNSINMKGNQAFFL